MKNIISLGFVGLIALFASGCAFSARAYTPPVYVEPAVVVTQPPVYVQPAPVYVQPAPVIVRPRPMPHRPHYDHRPCGRHNRCR